MPYVATSLQPRSRLASCALAICFSGGLIGLLAGMTAVGDGPGGKAALTVVALSPERARKAEQPRMRPAEPAPSPMRAPAPARPPAPAARPVPPLAPLASAPAGPAPSPSRPIALPASSEAAGGAAAAAASTGAQEPARDSGEAQDAPSAPAASSASDSSGRDAYGRKVYARIRQRQSYDPALAAKGISGTVVLSFAVDGRGRLEGERVLQSSGHAVLDTVALGQLRAASPFPAPPARRTRMFTIPLTYQTLGRH